MTTNHKTEAASIHCWTCEGKERAVGEREKENTLVQSASDWLSREKEEAELVSDAVTAALESKVSKLLLTLFAGRYS